MLYTCGKQILDDNWIYVNGNNAGDRATPIRGFYSIRDGIFCGAINGPVLRMCVRCQKVNGLLW